MQRTDCVARLPEQNRRRFCRGLEYKALDGDCLTVPRTGTAFNGEFAGVAMAIMDAQPPSLLSASSTKGTPLALPRKGLFRVSGTEDQSQKNRRWPNLHKSSVSVDVYCDKSALLDDFRLRWPFGV